MTLHDRDSDKSTRNHPYDGRKHVLVRVQVSEYLRDCGYRVIEAVSAEEAITILQSGQVWVDLVFSDADLAGNVNGFGLSKWIRANCASVTFILSGSLDKTANLAADLCEAGPMLQKPYEPQTLVEMIKQLGARDNGGSRKASAA